MIPSPWVILGGILAALGLAGASFGAGWHLRSVQADRDALRVQNEALKGLADATKRASDAADEYARRRDAVEPQIRIVRVQAAPIVRELDRCPMPAGAGGLLDRAADAADAKDGGDRPDAASAATGDRQP